MLNNKIEEKDYISILDKDFINIVSEFKDFLNYIREEIENYERLNKGINIEEQIKYLETKKYYYDNINYYFEKLDLITKNLSSKEQFFYKHYFQKAALNYFVFDKAILNSQIYNKPLGYAGDYVVANYFYEDDYPGEGLYAKFIDRYTLSIPLTRAHIYRRTYFRNLINSILDKRLKEKVVRISSFACGPAIEIIDVIRERDDLENVIFSCLDGEKKAIEQIRCNINELEKTKKNKINIKLYNENILNLVRNNLKISELLKQDLIYCAGFIDYLSDRTSMRLIKYLYELLDDNGILVLVNVYKTRSLRVYLEFIGEWYLHHRDENDILFISKPVSMLSEIHIELCPITKSNIYLVIKNSK